MRPDRGADGDGPVELVEAAPLFDVELEVGPDPGEHLRVGAHVRGLVPGRGHRLGHGDAVGVDEGAGAVGVERAGEDSRTGAGDPEAGALLVGEVRDGQRTAGDEPVRAQRVERGEGGDDAEGAVESAAVGDGVEVRAEDDPGPALGERGVGVLGPGPLVPRAIDDDGHPPALGRPLEPFAQRVVGGGPGEAVVAAGACVAPDVAQVVPEPGEGAHLRFPPISTSATVRSDSRCRSATVMRSSPPSRSDVHTREACGVEDVGVGPALGFDAGPPRGPCRRAGIRRPAPGRSRRPAPRRGQVHRRLPTARTTVETTARPVTTASPTVGDQPGPVCASDSRYGTANPTYERAW